MSASLPMYDWPEVRGATDLWWSILAQSLTSQGFAGVPQGLRHDAPLHELWSDPDLLISQTCGYPLTHAWSDRLQPVATPCYAVEGCSGADYSSFVLVRRGDGVNGVEDLRGARAVVNGDDSQSGYSALRAVVAPHAPDGSFFSAVMRSGAHLKSMEMVVECAADVCAVDAVAWALARDHRSTLAGELRVVAMSPAAPGLPYVTSPGRPREEVERIRAALDASLDHPEFPQVRQQLYVTGFERRSLQDYRRIIDMEQASIRAGYPEVR